jgi:excisionase family DNA binding protein
MGQEMMTLDEVASYLRVKYERAAQLARCGILPTVRLGRQIRIQRSQLEAFIAHGGYKLPGGWRKETRHSENA